MESQGTVQEKRKHNRKRVKITALLKMGIHLSGRGYAKDVSKSGMCLVAPSVFQFIRQSQINDFLGAHIRVMFPAQSLTVNGTLVRVEPAKGEGALLITSTSNDSAWETLCTE